MEISIKMITLFAAVLLTGLSAGFFYAWAVSVIPGTKKVGDLIYLETMQSINQAILNPAFFLIFFGSMICLGIASIYEFHSNKVTFSLLLASSVTYLFGTLGVTVFGNVPLNDALDVIDLSEQSIDQLAKFRQGYELKWNKLHMIRTVFAVLSFLLSLLAVFSLSRTI